MTLRSWKFRALLPAVTAIISVGCAPISSQASGPTVEAAPVNSINTAELDRAPAGGAIAPDAPELAQQPPEQNTLPDIITGMEVGMPYAEARALIDQEIWAPKTHPPLDHVSASVQKMRDLGYEEVRDCAGTGLGLCRLEFIEREGLVLVIIVTTSDTEPMVWSWGVE